MSDAYRSCRRSCKWRNAGYCGYNEEELVKPENIICGNFDYNWDWERRVDFEDNWNWENRDEFYKKDN